MRFRPLFLLFLWIALPGARCGAREGAAIVPLALRTQPPEFDLTGRWKGCTTFDSENSALLELEADEKGLEVRETLFQGLNCATGQESLRTMARYRAWKLGPYVDIVQSRTLEATLVAISLTPLRADLASEMNADSLFEVKDWKLGVERFPLEEKRVSARVRKGDVVYGSLLPIPDGGFRLALPAPLSMDAAVTDDAGTSATRRATRLTELPLLPDPR